MTDIRTDRHDRTIKKDRQTTDRRIRQTDGRIDRRINSADKQDMTKTECNREADTVTVVDGLTFDVERPEA